MIKWYLIGTLCGVILGSIISNVIFYFRSGHGIFSVYGNENTDKYNLVLTTSTDKLRKCRKLIFKVVNSPSESQELQSL